MRRRFVCTLTVAVSAAALSAVVAAPPASAATFTTSAALNTRSAPSLQASTVKVNAYASGASISISCQARGDMAYGSVVWDKEGSGHWVTDAYVRTGYSGFDPNLPRCNDISGNAHLFPATANLDGRAAPGTSARVVEVNQYLSGQSVPVVCQATGPSAYGSTIWDKTSDNTWVTDAYVKTGYSGFASGVPQCQQTTATTHGGYLAETDLNGRNGTSLSATTMKTYPGGTLIDITCQAIGENAYGSNIWDKTSDGYWVADHYVKTGYDTFAPGIGRCADTTTNNGTGYLAETTLNGRTSKSLSATTAKTYASGSTIHIACQAYGPYAYGSYIWDKTTDGYWVTDYYVKTGTTGFISNMSRCDSDQPSGGPSGSSSGAGNCSVGHGRINGPAGSTSGTASDKIERVISAAEAMTTKGLTYSWGAGGKGGPSCGISSLSPSGIYDYNSFGFDCSGFTEYAFWAGAGVDIGTNTNTQSLTSVGRRVAYSDVQRGDLIFWGSPGSTDHVAIYIGNGRMLEAAPPRDSSSVHETNVYGTHTFAVRVFG